MTTIVYRRYTRTGSFVGRRLYNRLVKSVMLNGLFYGGMIWFMMVFAMTKMYLWRICAC